MSINFFYVKHRHRMWKMYLKGHLLDLNEIEKERIISSKECELGKWIQEYALKHYSDFTELHEIIKLHDQIHQCVEAIFQAKTNNKTEDGFTKLNNLETYSSQMLSLLDILEEKVSQQKKLKVI